MSQYESVLEPEHAGADPATRLGLGVEARMRLGLTQLSQVPNV